MHSPKVLVIGKGAIGVAVACRLKILGYSPVFVGRKGSIDVHVHFKGWGQSFWLDVKKLTEADLSKVVGCFIAVKAFDLEGAAGRFLPYLPSEVPVISLSNGATQGIVERVQKKFPTLQMRLGFCTAGVTTVNVNHFELRSSKGGVFWGKIARSQKMTPFENDLVNVKCDSFFNMVDHVFPAHRMKWLFNTVMNSICAVKQYERNGLLLDDLEYLRGVFSEAFELGSELWGEWPESRQRLFDDLISLITATRENENSMHKDMRLNLRTEADYLSGLAKDSSKYPCLTELTDQIRKSSAHLIR